MNYYVKRSLKGKRRDSLLGVVCDKCSCWLRNNEQISGIHTGAFR